MHDEKNPRGSTGPRTPENPGHSTGPRSRDGKARSSLNRLTHGCRSEQLILPTEDPAEFEFTIDAWLEAYNPQDAIAQNLVQETAKAHWFLKRNEKRLHQVESSLPVNACQWTDENHKAFTNFTRYKTTAERTFFRWYKALETHYHRESHRQELADRARARSAALNIQWLNKQEEKAAQELKIHQCAQILGDDESCATTLAPTNEQIENLIASRSSPPEIVTRFLHFLNGVPPAYDWINPTLIQREFECIGIQSMLYTDWLEIIAREKASGTGHLGPAPSLEFLTCPPSMPR
jgi:hypothetical protein